MKKVGWFVVVAAAAVLLGVGLSMFNPIRNLWDDLFGRETYTANGDVVLEQLRESKALEAAEGTFSVPVVVCNGTAKAFGPDEDFEEVLSGCNGLLDEKATVLIDGHVRAVIALDALDDSDVEINGSSIRVRLPEPVLEQPTVDAESGVKILSIDDSFLPGSLPDDYLSRAAEQGKDAVSEVAGESDLQAMAQRSAESLFGSMLRSFGFTDVTIEFVPPEAGG